MAVVEGAQGSVGADRRSRATLLALRKQVEHYFSEGNYSRDAFYRARRMARASSLPGWCAAFIALLG